MSIVTGKYQVEERSIPINEVRAARDLQCLPHPSSVSRMEEEGEGRGEEREGRGGEGRGGELLRALLFRVDRVDTDCCQAV